MTSPSWPRRPTIWTKVASKCERMAPMPSSSAEGPGFEVPSGSHGGRRATRPEHRKTRASVLALRIKSLYVYTSHKPLTTVGRRHIPPSPSDQVSARRLAAEYWQWMEVRRDDGQSGALVVESDAFGALSSYKPVACRHSVIDNATLQLQTSSKTRPRGPFLRLWRHLPQAVTAASVSERGHVRGWSCSIGHPRDAY